MVRIPETFRHCCFALSALICSAPLIVSAEETTEVVVEETVVDGITVTNYTYDSGQTITTAVNENGDTQTIYYDQAGNEFFSTFEFGDYTPPPLEEVIPFSPPETEIALEPITEPEFPDIYEIPEPLLADLDVQHLDDEIPVRRPGGIVRR